MAKKYLVRHGETEVSMEFRREDDGTTWVRREGEDAWDEVRLERAGDSGLYVLAVNSRPTEIYLDRRRGGAIATIGRHTFDCDVGPWRPAGSRGSRAGGASSGTVKLVAPMTGSVVEVRCEVGQAVTEGDVLLVIESMKMNNEFRAPVTGTVETVAVKAAQRVTGGQLLIALQRASEA